MAVEVYKTVNIAVSFFLVTFKTVQVVLSNSLFLYFQGLPYVLSHSLFLFFFFPHIKFTRVGHPVTASPKEYLRLLTGGAINPCPEVTHPPLPIRRDVIQHHLDLDCFISLTIYNKPPPQVARLLLKTWSRIPNGVKSIYRAHGERETGKQAWVCAVRGCIWMWGRESSSHRSVFWVNTKMQWMFPAWISRMALIFTLVASLYLDRYGKTLSQI